MTVGWEMCEAKGDGAQGRRRRKVKLYVLCRQLLKKSFTPVTFLPFSGKQRLIAYLEVRLLVTGEVHFVTREQARVLHARPVQNAVKSNQPEMVDKKKPMLAEVGNHLPGLTLERSNRNAKTIPSGHFVFEAPCCRSG